MSSKYRKKIGVSDDIPKSTKNDLNIVLKKVQNPKERKNIVKIPTRRNCSPSPPSPAPRTPFKTVNIKRDFVNNVIMTVESTSNKFPINKRQLPIRRGPKMKSEAAIVARTIDKNELVGPVVSKCSIKEVTENSILDKPQSNTSVSLPQPVIEAVESKLSQNEFRQLQGKISFVDIGDSGKSLHSASSKSSSLYVSSRGEDLRTDNDSFYDCFESKSSSVLKLFSRKDKHIQWKRDLSLSKLLQEEPDLGEDNTSEEKINTVFPVHHTYSAHMLNNFKKLLHQHSPNCSSKPEDGRLSGEDIDVLKKLVEADERYCYLKQEDHHLLKEVLMEQLKQIELQERVFEATLKKLKQSISSCDVSNPVPTPENVDVVKPDIISENIDDKFKVTITPLSINVDLMEALTPETGDCSYDMPRVSISDFFSKPKSESPPSAPAPQKAGQKAAVPSAITKEEQINDKKKFQFLSQSARNAKPPKKVKKDTFNRQQEVEVVFKNIPTHRKEAKILNVISARLEKAYGKGPTPKVCLEDLGNFLNHVSAKVKEQEAEVDKKLKGTLSSVKRGLRKKYKIKFEYYAFCQRHLTRKASIFFIAESLLLVKEFVVQYLCMDDIKSAGTFYVFQSRNGYNADLEEMDFSKLRNQPELLAKMFRTDKPKACPDISIFEYETALEESKLKGHKREWRRHGDSEYSMKQLMYCLFKTWARYPTLYNPRLQPGDIAQLVENKSMLHISPTSSKISTTASVKSVVTATSEDIPTIDKDLETAEFGSKMKRYLVPTVQITLFAIFVLSFVAFEYRCL